MPAPKEANEVRQVGVIPSEGADPIPVGKIPDAGTQVVKGTYANNSVVTLHTVTTGKILYLSAAALSIKNVSGGEGEGAMYVTDGEDAIRYYLFLYQSPDQHGTGGSIPLISPLEISAGWKIKVASDTASVYVTGFIHGYEA